MSQIALSAKDREQLLERFLRYVQVDTQSDEESDSCPSTEKQKNLGRMLVDELKELGCDDARMDQHGYVYASLQERLPSNHPASGKVPPVGLIAHMDTYFATPGANVKPNVIERYEGGDIVLPGDPDQVIRFEESANLKRCIGETIVTSDGTTLLGADDKAGIAEIMTALAWLREHDDVRHGPIRVAFTPDEEIGRGADKFDVEAFGAGFAYTLDGSELGEIENETFCADTANVTVTGHDVHPGYGKGKLVSAVRAAAALVEGLPEDFLPETTEGREPYLHPYTMSGDVSEVKIKLLARAFTVDALHEREDALGKVVSEVETRFPKVKIAVDIEESYRNMGIKIDEDRRVLDNVLEGVRRTGVEPVQHAIRGGTDGARLSFMGVLTPNIWAGAQEFHSLHEWVCLDWMGKATEAALNTLQVWVERST